MIRITAPGEHGADSSYRDYLSRAPTARYLEADKRARGDSTMC